VTISVKRVSDFLCRRVLLLILLAGLLTTSASALSAADASRPPNFIVILMDDMGWRDVGFMGNEFVETPHLDRLAAGGLVYTQAYASAPNCAPTRACLMSGQYPPRHGVYTVVDPRQLPGSPGHKLLAAESKSELAPEFVTIAEALKSGGYATAFFGMWNLGRGRRGPVTPGGQGFDHVVFPENIGFGKNAYFDDDGKYLSDRLTDEVLSFIEQHRDAPFFVYLPDHAVHAPLNPKPELLRKYERKLAAGSDRRDDPAAAATIEAVDQNVGRIVDILKRLQLTDNTVVIFTSDNGGTQQYTPPLRGSKGELYEGGIRVPLVISWTGLQGTGRRCDVPVVSIDLYPTLLDLAGIDVPDQTHLDGVSLAPLFAGATELPPRPLYWHFPCYVGRATPCSALRVGDDKLIQFFEDGGHVELYNLRSDPAEEHDLSRSKPELAAAMLRQLESWQQETGAALPRGSNPDYDPRAERSGGGLRRNGR